MAGAWVSILNRTGQRPGPWGGLFIPVLCVFSSQLPE